MLTMPKTLSMRPAARQRHAEGRERPRSYVETRIAVAMTLRYLAGGAFIDQCIIYRVAHQLFYSTVKRTIERLFTTLPAFVLEPALRARDTAILDRISAGFSTRTDGLLTGVIGAIDGLLIPIRRPGKLMNERVYHCRKGFYALNIQAIADRDGRFLHASVGRCPGAAHDSYAWSCDPLCEILRGKNDLANWLRETGRYIIGDDAYASSHTLVVPWPGKHTTDSPELAYNEMHSSARISVECAFGMFCRKWLLTKRPYEMSLRRTALSAGFQQTMTVAMKLHNLSLSAGTGIHETDISGDHEVAEGRQRRRDHLDRERAVDPYLPHISSEDPDRAAVERAAGNYKAASMADKPAWLPRSNVESMFDSAFDEGTGDSEPRENATCHLRKPPREAVTDYMGTWGMKRRKAVHWRT